MHSDQLTTRPSSLPLAAARMFVAALLFTSGCATGGDLQLDQRNGRVGFDRSRVGTEQAKVLEAASAQFSVPADCAAGKGGLTHSRKAMFLETCRFDLQSRVGAGTAPVMFGDEVLTAAEFDFIDGRLLQMHLRFDAGARDLDALASRIAASLGERLQDAAIPLRALTPASEQHSRDSAAQSAAQPAAQALWSSDPVFHGASRADTASAEAASMAGKSRDRIDITADRLQRSIAIAIVDARLGPLLIPR